MSRWFRAPSRLVLMMALAGCAGSETTPRISALPKIPGHIEEAEVTSARTRAGYIEAMLQFSEGSLGLYFPENSVCRDLLPVGGRIEYQRLGLLGQVLGNGVVCEALGTFTLAEWRARRPRPQLADRERQTARFEPVHADDDVLMARGRFPGVGYLDFVGDDVIVVVASSPECRGILDRREALVEFRATGDSVLTLLGGETRCEILGVVQPMRR